jgi:hypothetical protein
MYHKLRLLTRPLKEEFRTMVWKKISSGTQSYLKKLTNAGFFPTKSFMYSAHSRDKHQYAEPPKG